MSRHDDIKADLWKLAQPRPLLAGLLMKRIAGKTVGEQWASILSQCKQHHLEDVLEEWQTRRMPERLDDLVFLIRSECKEREDKENRQWIQQEKYHSRKKMPWRDGQNHDPTCVAIRHILKKPVGIHDLNQLAKWGRNDDPNAELPECLRNEQIW